MRRRADRAPGYGATANAQAAEVRLGSRWASTVAATATAAIAVVLALLAVSGPRVAVRDRETQYKNESVAAETDVASAAGWAGRVSEDARPAARKLSIPIRRPAESVANSDPRSFSLRNPARPRGPTIAAVSATSVGFGHKVTLRGSRLKGTRRVLFLGAEGGRADARFVVWDDDRLIVSVPDLGTRQQDAAVAVVTHEGVALSLPSDAALPSHVAASPGPVCVVRTSGFSGRGDAPVVYVETGAAARAGDGATLFVRSGGRVPSSDSNCLIYCEPGVVASPGTSGRKPVEVGAINPCIVPSLFHYTGR